jgi:hypothetical protein
MAFPSFPLVGERGDQRSVVGVSKLWKRQCTATNRLIRSLLRSTPAASRKEGSEVHYSESA